VAGEGAEVVPILLEVLEEFRLVQDFQIPTVMLEVLVPLVLEALGELRQDMGAGLEVMAQVLLLLEVQGLTVLVMYLTVLAQLELQAETPRMAIQRSRSEQWVL
jgi:hypothetical protein